MTRSAQEVFSAHVASVAQGDMKAILGDYRDDAVVLTAQGALQGHSGIEAFYTQALTVLPEPQFNVVSANYSGDALLLRWTATSPAGRVEDGVDTFVFDDGMIQLQTSSFTVEPLSAI